MMNAGTSIGRIPAKEWVRERAMVMAGFANEVEAVNHTLERGAVRAHLERPLSRD